MELKRFADLQSGIKETAEWLNRDLGKALEEELERIGREGGARAESGILNGHTLERFWEAALDFTKPFHDPPTALSTHLPALSAHLPARLPPLAWSRFYQSYMDTLSKTLEAPSSPVRSLLENHFSGVFVLDGATLQDVAYRLQLKDEDGPLALPGRVAGLYEVGLGFAVRLGFEPDQGRPDHAPDLLSLPRMSASRPGREEAVASPAAGEAEGGFLPPGSLILGDGRYATLELFERLERCGLHGALAIGQRADLRVCSVLEEARWAGGALKDAIVEMTDGSSLRRLRRVSKSSGGKEHAVLTDVLDPVKLPARMAALLVTPRWQVEKVFGDVAGMVDLTDLGRDDLQSLEGHLFLAALLSSAFRAAHLSIAGGLGLPATLLNPRSLYPELARVASGMARRKGGSRRPEGGSIIATLDSDLGAYFPDGPVEPTLPVPLTRRKRPAPATREEMVSVSKIVLDPPFEPFCRAYAEVGHRDPFLWPWVQRGIELTTLPSIASPWWGPNRTVKLLGVMLDVLLDDVADNLKDGDFLGCLLNIPFSAPFIEPSRGPSMGPAGGPVPGHSFTPDRARYYRFTAEVWAEIYRLAQSFPRYQELRAVFEFDYRQLLNTMSYAYLVNRMPEILNPTEHDLYQPHNMHMMISGTLDLMCSPGFERQELALIRQAIWRGQVMGRIGNMVSTWEREIKERDFTSGVFATAIEWRVVNASELPRMDPATLTEAINSSGVIEYFLSQWERLRDEVYAFAERVRSIDLSRYGAGLEELIRNHLGSRGLK